MNPFYTTTESRMQSMGRRWHGNRAARLLVGLLLITSLSAGAAEPAPLNLNLKDVELSNLIESVSAITGRNFIIDPRVKGKVTVIAPGQLSPEEAYQVFLSVLSVHGFTAVPAGSVIKIVPEVNAKQDAIPTVTDRDPGVGDEVVTRVVQVNNVAAVQLVPILRPLLPQEAHLAAYQPSNVLIASGTAANIERMVRLIRSIDQTSEAEIEVVRLQHASADEVMRILTSLSAASKGAAAGAQGGVDSDMKIVADTRTNSILLSGDKSERNKVKQIIDDLDTPLNSGGSTDVIYLRYADATELVQVLNGVSSSITSGANKGGTAAAGGATAGVGNAKVTIQADEATNALVINAPPDVMRDLRTVINKLDVRRAQVLVEAIIAEVSSDKANELGVQWGYDGSSESAPVGIVNFGGSGSGIATLATGILSGSPSIGDGLTLAMGDTNGEGSGVAAVLRALAGDAETNILSTPSLVTMDNQEAEIVVGQNVPFVTGSYTSTGSTSTVSNPFQTIERQDVGLTLKVKPQINEGDTVKLEITQEVSSISSSTTGASDLITNKRSLTTTVMVDDGSAIVLGGLIDDTLRESVQKVPLLGDIPLLGSLFSYRSTTKVKRNLMIFLHPVILREAGQHAAISRDRYGRMRNHQLGMRERGVHLMADSEAPLMPDWNELLALPPSFDNWQQQHPGESRVQLPPAE